MTRDAVVSLCGGRVFSQHSPNSRTGFLASPQFALLVLQVDREGEGGVGQGETEERRKGSAMVVTVVRC